MSWRRHFTPIDTSNQSNLSPISGLTNTARPGPARSNYSSFLPDIYVGTPNRIERYMQYDTMDMDPEVNAALDILAEFCTQKNKENNTTFNLSFKDRATNSEIRVLREYLQQWFKLQQFDTRFFRIVRNTFKFGDSWFIRDPETQKWFYVDPSKMVKIIVNESDGKKPEQYVVRDLNPNFKNLVATQIQQSPHQTNNRGSNYIAGGGMARGATGAYPTQYGDRFSTNENEMTIDAAHVIHLSLSEGLDNNYPFGNSLLEQVFKVYKQKELLEDAILIYRIQRAPERRIFYIDVGNMPSHMAMSFVERVKNEIHQRRIPSQNGGGMNIIDSAYNPLSIGEDYFFPQTEGGRGSKVETLAGGQNLGEIDDLRYFTNKLFRALRIPSSYLPSGPDDGQQQYNDGRVGTAYIQELRFNNYCMRLQTLLTSVFDEEFKRFLYNRGVNIDTSLFEIKFQTPLNFAAYRQSEMDGQRINTFSTIQQVPYMSKRFALKRFLGLSEEEIAENENLWRQEKGMAPITGTDASGELRGAGLSAAGIDSDLEMAGDTTAPEDMSQGMPGGIAPETGMASPVAAVPPM